MAAVNSVAFCLDIAAPVQVFIRNSLPGKNPSVHAGQFRFISKLLDAIAKQTIHFDHSGVRSGLVRLVLNVTRIYWEPRVGGEIVVMQKDAGRTETSEIKNEEAGSVLLNQLRSWKLQK